MVRWIRRLHQAVSMPAQDDFKTLPLFAPLLAAVIAPLSTLFDIPALTEPWFFQHNSGGGLTQLPDERANIVLSAVGLAFNVLANALLIFRFSVSDGLWKYATRASLACWVVKFGIALGNILYFGIQSRNTPGIYYGEAFWCALVSLILVFFITALLLSHYMLHIRGRTQRQMSSTTSTRVRIAGRHFMLQNTLFVLTIGLLALYMSRLENWTYLQGIYFSVVAILTIGFGDFYPTKPATQIMLFPFALIGIVQLASIIDLLVRFFRGRIASRQAERRRAFEKRRQEEENKLEKEPDLERELEFLKKLYHETDRWKTTRDLVTNCSGFVFFWVLGALMFSQIESWTYGEGLYFCYVFFFTIGFGDYVPVTPAGRVFFIIYSIFAVPVIASFAVQTIQSVFQRLSANILRRYEEKAGVTGVAIEEQTRKEHNGIANTDDEENGLPEDARERLRRNDSGRKYRKTHTDFVMAEHRRIKSQLLSNGHWESRQREDIDRETEEGAEEREKERGQEEDRILTEYILELAVELEKHARRLLLGHMEECSRARMLLKADRIVQLQNIKALAAQEKSGHDDPERRDDSSRTQSLHAVSSGGGRSRVNEMMRNYYEEETELLPFPTELDEQETLEEVARYREAFAGLLAAGSRLLRLKDEESALFERRYWKGVKVG